MTDLNQILIVLIPVAAYFISLLGRKYLFLKKHVRKTLALIDKIRLHRMDDIWSPEIQIEYSFYLEGNRYTGNDFIRMDRLLGESNFLLADQKGFPVLNSGEGQYVGEEHIEHHLLQKQKEIVIGYYERNPFESRIHKMEEPRSGHFSDIKTGFPWVS